MNIAIIGTGKIVQEALPVIAATHDITLRCLWAREHSLAKAQALAEQYHIPVVTAHYAAVLADPHVDTVYVALINSVHYAYARQALEAGKHVILEKPACLCHGELLALATEARRRGLMLFEAVTLLHLPAFHLVKEQLLPQIGIVRHAECVYGQRSSRYDAYLRGEVLPAFDPAAGGGALMDLNIYNLHFVHALWGRPASCHYSSNLGFNGIDLSGTVELRYADLPPLSSIQAGTERVCLCTGAKDANAHNHALLQGDNGWLRIDGPVSTMASVTLCLRGEQPRVIPQPTVSHRLAPEFAAFASILHRGDYAAMNRLLDHSLAVMDTLDACRTT